MQDTDEFMWIVVLGAIASFYAAFGIGANDVANAFASSVGSKALTIKQACGIAVICEFIGATLLGGEVVKTIRKGIANEEVFADNPPLLMWGCLCALFSVGSWLIIASRFEMPVSTTHSCIGGMIGMAIALKGIDAVVWYSDSSLPDKPLPGGFVGVLLSWFISPVLSGIIACSLFASIRCILRSQNPFANSVKLYPFLVFFCVTIISLFMLTKGIKSIEAINNLDDGVRIGISFALGTISAGCAYPLSLMCKRKILQNSVSIENIESTQQSVVQLDNAAEIHSENDKNTTFNRIKSSIMSSFNTDIHAVVSTDSTISQIHMRAEKFDKNAEKMFTYLQIFSACFDSLAHGANDVANAVGPFATIFLLYNGSDIGSDQDMGSHKWWILSLGGMGIGFGLLLYGSQILRAIGVKMATITPSRGFSIEMGSSTIVIIGAYYGLPLSTTHCQVGATMGVALLEGVRGFNRKILLKTVFGWVFTCVFVGLMAGLIAAFGAYAPSVSYTKHVCVNISRT